MFVVQITDCNVGDSMTAELMKYKNNCHPPTEIPLCSLNTMQGIIIYDLAIATQVDSYHQNMISWCQRYITTGVGIVELYDYNND